jgi:hypothetical protein
MDRLDPVGTALLVVHSMRPTPARLTCSKNGSPRHPPPTRSSAPWGELPPVPLTEPRELELFEQCTGAHG